MQCSCLVASAALVALVTITSLCLVTLVPSEPIFRVALVPGRHVRPYGPCALSVPFGRISPKGHTGLDDPSGPSSHSGPSSYSEPSSYGSLRA
jgi:hypothetical protein